MSEAIRSPLSENEIEFLAEDELITITPAFHCGKVACMMVASGAMCISFPQIRFTLFFIVVFLPL